MRRFVFLPMVCCAIAFQAGAQSDDLTGALWRDRIAVGMRWGGAIPPLTVEASTTGWVTLSFLPMRPEVGIPAAPQRLMVETRDLRAWIDRVRPFLAALADSTAKYPRTPFTLGNGAFQVDMTTYGGRDRLPVFNWRSCNATTNSSAMPSLAEATSLIELLDSAVAVAGVRAGRPPTLSRPYYSNEVSCPAIGEPTNVPPTAPPKMSRAEEVGVQFVVDTAGLVERRSIRVLPGASRIVADSVRSAVSRWRFHPPEIDGTPVRQFVQTAVAMTPRAATHPAAQPGAQPAVVIEATDEGWVHVHRDEPVSRSIAQQQWFTPDSVDAFVARLRALNREADSLPKDTNIVRQKTTALGTTPGVALVAGYLRNGKVLQRTGLMSWCNGGASPAGVNDVAEAFEQAAKAAREHRASPAERAADIYSSNDVACAATLKWTQLDSYGPRNLWHRPTGAYPASMRSTNARAEVLAAFIVDTTGAVEPGSITVAAGSDSRAVAELPATLSAYLYRPATRAGQKVRQRIIQVFRFEPPPICTSSRANPACPRDYSPR